ncbi:hypothetical protein FKG94_21750 [Exilibacterium tricleocarpae]|uniref:Uncharacterized protein n=1 Tax=Exilibacterium tricleocarpae TaxID=2591008 RepID=A0A545SYX2_9GAMM|nr:hypothetical protein [Exilibacterium tricleocarpae]TQV70150.1 hypothetical protein FKG94_21750 [Exilibacterium tricleocarpae]
MLTKYRGHYSLTTVSEQGEVDKCSRSTEFEVDEFEHPGARLRRIAYAAMEKYNALGVSIGDFREVT